MLLILLVICVLLFAMALRFLRLSCCLCGKNEITQLTDVKGGAATAGIRPKDVLLSVNGNSLSGDST